MKDCTVRKNFEVVMLHIDSPYQANSNQKVHARTIAQVGKSLGNVELASWPSIYVCS